MFKVRRQPANNTLPEQNTLAVKLVPGSCQIDARWCKSQWIDTEVVVMVSYSASSCALFLQQGMNQVLMVKLVLLVRDVFLSVAQLKNVYLLWTSYDIVESHHTCRASL